VVKFAFDTHIIIYQYMNFESDLKPESAGIECCTEY
jgi:hypothetical protein